MNVTCDGRKLNPQQAQTLMMALEPDMMRTMAAQGFSLCSMRAPRSIKGNLVVRFAWRKNVDGVKLVVRGTATFQPPARP